MKSQVEEHRENRWIGGSSFLVTIRYQENYSWQGTVQWLESGQVIHFRSELELLHLIQEGVEKKENKEKKYRTWNSQEEAGTRREIVNATTTSV